MVPAIEPVSWSFRLRFDLGDTSNLPFDEDEWLISDADAQRIILKPADGTDSLSTARRVQLVGHGYDAERPQPRKGTVGVTG